MTTRYRPNKGLGVQKGEKTEREKFISVEEVGVLLDTIEHSDAKHRVRDHAAIFMGFFFALRCGEACLLTREDFRDLERGLVRIPTLKAMKRIPHHCGQCGCRRRVGQSKIGRMHKCGRCGHRARVEYNGRVDTIIPRKSPSVVEKHVLAYVREYLDSLPEDQEYLFQGSPGKPLSRSSMHNIFNYWVTEAGLPPIYSFHALRHGRCVLLWDVSKDPKLIQDVARHKGILADVYAHMSERRRAEYLDQLEGDSKLLGAHRERA